MITTMSSTTATRKEELDAATFEGSPAQKQTKDTDSSVANIHVFNQYSNKVLQGSP